MSKVINCEFTSVWSDGSVLTTECTYNINTGEVTPTELEPSTMSIDANLEREFIEFEDGETMEVCMDCHCFVLKPVMLADNVGHGIHTTMECTDPECDSHNLNLSL